MNGTRERKDTVFQFPFTSRMRVNGVSDSFHPVVASHHFFFSLVFSSFSIDHGIGKRREKSGTTEGNPKQSASFDQGLDQVMTVEKEDVHEGR